MREFFSHIGPPPVASLLFAIAFVLVMYLLAWLMWRRRVFIKV
jgi:predicted acyltransferase